MMKNNLKNSGALYYPYIHIKDINWLKANLIIFPRVKRMIPMDFLPNDAEEIRKFTINYKNRDPLLQGANLLSSRSVTAQAHLAVKIIKSCQDQEFIDKYGRDTLVRKVKEDDYGFQIHVGKFSAELLNALMYCNLGWNPENREPYDQYSEYIEVHPRVGEAIMSTMAIACAQAEGLDIVGDNRSGELHHCLLEKKLDHVYESWLGTGRDILPPNAASGEELMEFILGIPGDLSSLTVEKLHEFNEAREPIDKLINKLRDYASEIPAMDKGKERDEAFKDAVSKVIQEWQSDRTNLTGFFRAFFGQDTVKMMNDFLKTVADKSATGAIAGAAAKATASAANFSAGWWGSLLNEGILLGGGAGLVIGLFSHAGVTYHKQRQKEKDSPYKFLTTLLDSGVMLFSEANSAKIKSV